MVLYYGSIQLKEYDSRVFGQKKPSLARRVLSEIIRVILVGIFLYIAYLGISMRKFPVPSGSKALPSAQPAIPEMESF